MLYNTRFVYMNRQIFFEFLVKSMHFAAYIYTVYTVYAYYIIVFKLYNEKNIIIITAIRH